MMVERKDLMLNYSVMAIEKHEDKILLLVSPDDDFGGMRAVSPAEFIEEFKKLAFVFAVSWNKELINDYRAFYEYYQDVVHNEFDKVLAGLK